MSDFTKQSGSLAYEVELTPSTTSGSFSFGLQLAGGTGGTLENPRQVEKITGLENFSYSLDSTEQQVAVGNPDSGIVNVYYHFGSPEIWQFQERVTGALFSGNNPRFGESVQIENSTLIVGAPQAEISGIRTGAAVVFKSWNTGRIGGTTGTKWGQQAIITGDPISGEFGRVLDLESESILAIAAPTENNYSGGVYVYGGTNYRLQKKLTTPPDITGHQFGGSLQVLSGDAYGIGLAVGSYESRAGAVYIFQQGALGGWGQIQKITAPDSESGDLFGASITANQNSLVIGSPYYNPTTKSGRAYLYEYNTSSNRWDLEKVLYPNSMGPNDQFGKSLSMNTSNILIGSNSQGGSVYLFKNEKGWKERAQITGSGVGESGAFGGNPTGSKNLDIFEEDVLIGTTNDSSFYYFTTGVATGQAAVALSFSGVSGRLLDNEGKYIYSYLSGVNLNISGNVFTGYHNYFIDKVLTNSNSSRTPGDIDSYYVSGTGGLSNFYIRVNGP